MKKIRIGGVPEYFNLPILLALEKGKFAEQGIDLIWQEVPEGTGKMVQLLADDSLDMVIALTEGMTKSIAQGNPSSIIHSYIQSPLIWGIHAANHSSAEKIEDLKGKPFAISRYGSGSHLMAILLAKDLGWEGSDLKFEVIDNLDGAREALKKDEAHIFLWEKYTTKFLVDQNEFKRVGEYPAPWPCFVIGATNAIIESEPEALTAVLETIIAEIKLLTQAPNAIQLIAERYQLQEQDVREFWPNIEWNHTITLPDAAVEKVLNTFQSLGQVESKDKKVTHSLK